MDFSSYQNMSLFDFVADVRKNGHFVLFDNGIGWRKMHSSYENMHSVLLNIASLKEKAIERGNTMIVRESLEKLNKICSEMDAFEVADFLDTSFSNGPYDMKRIYNSKIGWIIPSKKILNVIYDVQQKFNKTICDFGSGKGLLSFLLLNIGCSIQSVDKYIDESYFSIPSIIVPNGVEYMIPSTYILLMSWGLYPISILENYVKNGGNCIIIIGENETGCTNPPYNFFEGDSQWCVTIYEIPNFDGIYTKMSVSIRK